eukprot:6175981-Pleurochrysis_carterae.AAC.2
MALLLTGTLIFMGRTIDRCCFAHQPMVEDCKEPDPLSNSRLGANPDQIQGSHALYSITCKSRAPNGYARLEEGELEQESAGGEGSRAECLAPNVDLGVESPTSSKVSSANLPDSSRQPKFAEETVLRDCQPRDMEGSETGLPASGKPACQHSILREGDHVLPVSHECWVFSSPNEAIGSATSSTDASSRVVGVDTFSDAEVDETPTRTERQCAGATGVEAAAQTGLPQALAEGKTLQGAGTTKDVVAPNAAQVDGPAEAEVEVKELAKVEGVAQEIRKARLEKKAEAKETMEVEPGERAEMDSEAMAEAGAEVGMYVKAKAEAATVPEEGARLAVMSAAAAAAAPTAQEDFVKETQSAETAFEKSGKVAPVQLEQTPRAAEHVEVATTAALSEFRADDAVETLKALRLPSFDTMSYEPYCLASNESSQAARLTLSRRLCSKTSFQSQETFQSVSTTQSSIEDSASIVSPVGLAVTVTDGFETESNATEWESISNEGVEPAS